MIIVLGEALVDLVAEPGGRRFIAHPGGSPANVAVGLGRLGVPVTLATQVGHDAFGRLVSGHVYGSGAELDVLTARSAATSLAVATLDADGAAEYDFRIDWDITSPPDLGTGLSCVHTGSLATALQPGADVVEEFIGNVRPRAVLSYDPNIRPSLERSRADAVARVERQVALADVAKASVDDVAWLYPDLDYQRVAARWKKLGTPLVVITLGAAGAFAATTDDAATRPSPEVTVADTVGAGDAFTAGLLSALHDFGYLAPETRGELAALSGERLASVVDYACLVAAITTGRPGADPPVRGEIAFG